MSKQHIVVSSIVTLATCQIVDAKDAGRTDAWRLTPPHTSTCTIRRADKEPVPPRPASLPRRCNEWDEWKSIRDMR